MVGQSQGDAQSDRTTLNGRELRADGRSGAPAAADTQRGFLEETRAELDWAAQTSPAAESWRPPTCEVVEEPDARRSVS